MCKRLIIIISNRLRNDARKKWKRVLPINEYFSDRWDKAKYLGFGEGSSIYDNSYVFGDVKIGQNTWVGPFTVLDGTNSISIGSNCDISAGVQIYTHNSLKEKNFLSNDFHQQITTKKYDKSVSIGNNVYIGPNSVISQGVKIGDNVIVGANSFVNKNLPSNCKAYGTPCKIFMFNKKPD